MGPKRWRGRLVTCFVASKMDLPSVIWVDCVSTPRIRYVRRIFKKMAQIQALTTRLITGGTASTGPVVPAVGTNFVNFMLCFRSAIAPVKLAALKR